MRYSGSKSLRPGSLRQTIRTVCRLRCCLKHFVQKPLHRKRAAEDQCRQLESCVSPSPIAGGELGRWLNQWNEEIPRTPRPNLPIAIVRLPSVSICKSIVQTIEAVRYDCRSRRPISRLTNARPLNTLCKHSLLNLTLTKTFRSGDRGHLKRRGRVRAIFGYQVLVDMF